MRSANQKRGTLYGIGVGPGDPELLTLKAARLLERIPVIFAASSSANEYSIAFEIIKEYVSDKRVERLPFPMTRDKEILEREWRSNALKVIEVLDQGKDAGFVTLGDPLTYSTFGYLLKTIRRIVPDVHVETVPGITSYHAAASRLNMVLAEAHETLLIVPGTEGAKTVRKAMESSDNVVILKVYRRFPEILEAVNKADACWQGAMISRCCLDGETIHLDLETLEGGTRPEYLSLMIVKRESGEGA